MAQFDTSPAAQDQFAQAIADFLAAKGTVQSVKARAIPRRITAQ